MSLPIGASALWRHTRSVLVGVQSQNMKIEFDVWMERQTADHTKTRRIIDETVDNRKDNETEDDQGD